MEIKIIYLEKVQCDNQAKSIIYHYLDISTRCSHPAFFKEVLKKQFDIQLPSPLENYSLYKFFSENNLSHLVCSLFNKILSISATNFHIYTQGLSSPIIYNGNEFLFATGSTDNQHQRLQLSFLFMKDLSKVCASQNCYIIIFFCFY